ncbi:MAG: OmpA family protein, partial [Nevskia sp.]|nr:OmpA family protein [Nevskia sp.]
LNGVFFDFNKDTLKPESESTLRSALAAIKGTPALAIEVQGHTDNVGGDDYNMKLSDARANTVMRWLVANGIPAAQLSAKGYGKTRPVASNDTDDGRARNRRVELACRK